jgi:hypothetical protein
MKSAALIGVLFFGGIACTEKGRATLPDSFLVRQMNVFYQHGARVVQSYAADPTLRYRGDVYDTAGTIIYHLSRCEIDVARPLADALVFLMDHDEIPDGRLHAAYWANDLLDPAGQYTSILDPDIAPGNMSWAGIAFARFYAATGERDYLEAATKIGDWILSNCKRTDSAGGFSGGLLGWNYDQVNWRATEHNIDVYSFGQILYELTGEERWRSMARHAQEFVQSMFVASDGYYMTGTRGPDGADLNPSPIAADTQSWAALASIDQRENVDRALQWLLDNLLVREIIDGREYVGIRFSSEGQHIVSEVTAGVAAALWLNGRQADAQTLIDGLAEIQAFAPRHDGEGIVATPFPGGAQTGYGSSYPNSLHVASTAWTGIALMVRCDSFANPLGVLPPPGNRTDRVPADYDCDCDADLYDFALFATCQSPSGEPAGAGCDNMDTDNDNDVDLFDFDEFQRCMSGDYVPVDPLCASQRP